MAGFLCVLLLLLVTTTPEAFQDMPKVEVFYISLKHRTDRRARITGTWPKGRFVEAVDGRSLGTPHQTMTKGEVGCFYSHLKALQAFIDSNAPMGLIMEDDCTLTPPVLAHNLPILLKEAPKDWGALSLGSNYIPPTAIKVSPHLVSLGHEGGLYGAHAIIYTRNAAVKYLKDAHKWGVTEPWDLWVGKSLAANMYVSDPYIAGVHDFEDTDTQRIR